MILRFSTDAAGCATVEILGPANAVLETLAGDRAVMIRQVEMVWGVRVRDDGNYPLF